MSRKTKSQLSSEATLLAAKKFTRRTIVKSAVAAGSIAAPDCGLGMLDRNRVMAKLRNMCEAAHSLG
ncbi:MAG TPA: hypothetical protein QGH84_01880 [Rhodospirillales bacterium]|jgi:methionine synthase II (cobalamin-independent)|nr:hypothetical protein [Rhodospirillales bacterium]